MTGQRIDEQIRREAEALEQEWETNPRWRGVERHLLGRGRDPAARFLPRGALPRAARRRAPVAPRARRRTSWPRWARSPAARPSRWSRPACRRSTCPAGRWPPTPTSSSQTYPDQSLYPANSVPAVVRRINNALQRADQIAWAEGTPAHTMAPIVADAEAGFGGTLNVLRADEVDDRGGRRRRALRGSARVREEVRPPGREGAGPHRPVRAHADRRRGWRPTCSDVPTLVVARTDALAATLLTSDIDERDRRFTTGERTHEGFYYVRNGHRGRDRARTGLRAVRGHALVRDRRRRTWRRRARSPTAIHAMYPDKLLAYNCSPSFNWKPHLDDATIATFQKELGAMGYRFQFITLAGFHALEREHVRAGQGLRRPRA